MYSNKTELLDGILPPIYFRFFHIPLIFVHLCRMGYLDLLEKNTNTYVMTKTSFTDERNTNNSD